MKKNFLVVILSLAMAFSLGSPIFADVALKAGVDLLGTWEVSDGGYSDDGDQEIGYFLGGEFSTGLSPLISLGGGVTYQFERADKDADGDGGFNFVPIYAFAHINLPAALADFFVAGHIGYNLLFVSDDSDSDTSGGIYYALGGGLKFPLGFQFELLYTMNNGEIEDADFKTSQFSLSVGLCF